MARKIHPVAYRVGVTKPWDARWYSPKHMAEWLREDDIIRKLIAKKIGTAGIARVEIERTPDRYRVYIKAARPGLIIGRGGKGIEDLTKAIEKAIGHKSPLSINVEELKRNEVSANVIGQNIVNDIARRMRFRRVMKKYIDETMMNKEVLGIKIRMSGRLDGAEIARTEWLAKGKLALQTLRSDVDYGETTAFTTYGAVGIKVWVYKGEVFNPSFDKRTPRRVTK